MNGSPNRAISARIHRGARATIVRPDADRRPIRSSRAVAPILALLLTLALGLATHALAETVADDTTAAAIAVVNEGQRDCLRCHAMSTLAYRDPANGEILSLVINPDALAHSAHGELDCTDCHRRSYRRYPHPEREPPNAFDCVGCHKGEGADLPYHWESIDAEFQQSVHARSESPKAADFSCHSCHDPHRFRMARVGEPLGEIIKRHNQTCLSCHQRLIAPGSSSHAWLPNRDAHWGSVRCVDCHTPAAGHADHQVLSAAESSPDCVGCHSTTPRLLERLYHFRSEEDIARDGLLAKAIFNEAYVVGMSRNPALDRLSLIGLGLVILLLAAHGVGRYLAHRAQSRPG